jgi:2,4-dienoyl-CoA reductase-like NADH-dependent reductase (Old Yellow Enzyme family)
MSDVSSAGAFSHLLSPFAIGKVTLRNRIVFQPHFTALGHADGMPRTTTSPITKSARGAASD